MEDFIEKLKKKVTVGLVGGSDLVKILEQLGGDDKLTKVKFVCYFLRKLNLKLINRFSIKVRLFILGKWTR